MISYNPELKNKLLNFLRRASCFPEVSPVSMHKHRRANNSQFICGVKLLEDFSMLNKLTHSFNRTHGTDFRIKKVFRGPRTEFNRFNVPVGYTLKRDATHADLYLSR